MSKPISHVNASASNFVFPVQSSLRHSLAKKLQESKPNCFGPENYDVQHLTKEQIDSFAKQKKTIESSYNKNRIFTLTAIYATIAAVVTLALAFFMAPLVLFPLAGVFLAGMITLIGLSIHQHIQKNKQINQLAQSILPVNINLLSLKNLAASLLPAQIESLSISRRSSL